MITVNDGVMHQLSLQAFPLYPNNNKPERGVWQVILLPHCYSKATVYIMLKKTYTFISYFSYVVWLR